MTPTPREHLEKSLGKDWVRYNERAVQILETLLEEARQEMKEKCLKCIPEPQDLGGTFTTLTHNLLATSIRDSISSL